MLSGSPALAQTDVIHLKKGEIVPFDGMLYPIKNAIYVSKKAERCDVIIEEEYNKFDRLFELQRQSGEDRLNIVQQGCKFKLDIAREAMQDNSSTLDLIIGFVSGAATIALAAWIVQKANN